MNPDFKTDWQDDAILPLDEVCDFAKWRENDNYMKIVNEEENVDLLGNKKMYVMQPSFTMCFLYKYQSDEHMLEVMNNIPLSAKMQVLITDPQNAPAEEEANPKPKECVSYKKSAVSTFSFDVYEREVDRAEARQRDQGTGGFENY